jgi:hypothetical protein
MVTRFSGKFVVDNKGKAVSVLLDIKTYHKLLAEIEELESIRAYDLAKASCDEAKPNFRMLQKKDFLLATRPTNTCFVMN